MSPGMFCGSNVTIFPSSCPVCAAKTPPDEIHYLSRFLSIQMNTMFSNINIQMSPVNALRFQ